MNTSSTARGARTVIEALTTSSLDEASEFLHRHMNRRISVGQWSASMRTPWQNPGPNHGYGLRANGILVGVYHAIYATRSIRGHSESFCNLAAWCVHPDFRAHSLSLLKRQLDHRDFHMTDLSPRPDVAKLMRRFGFRDLDTTSWVAPNMPWRGRRDVVTSLDEIARHLSGDAQTTFCDHRDLAAIQHVLLTSEHAPCHVIYQTTKKRGFPCAVVLHASAPDVLEDRFSTLAGYILRRHGVLFTICETRIVAKRPRLAALRAFGAKLFRSSTLEATAIDNLYSELVTLPIVSPG